MTELESNVQKQVIANYGIVLRQPKRAKGQNSNQHVIVMLIVIKLQNVLWNQEGKKLKANRLLNIARAMAQLSVRMMYTVGLMVVVAKSVVVQWVSNLISFIRKQFLLKKVIKRLCCKALTNHFHSSKWHNCAEYIKHRRIWCYMYQMCKNLKIQAIFSNTMCWL